ncbi:MAG: hypothetical protein QOH98_1570 [Methylobacteriaceae bacterium]|nr:hypothetical protein [Methylobacteriaceae bacterium]
MKNTMALACALAFAYAPAASARHAIAAPLCAAITHSIDAVGEGAPSPAFLASYLTGSDESNVPLPLRQSAFTYDNALATIALIACGDVQRARRIGDALLIAAEHDRNFADGRIRNAYRAGLVDRGKPIALPGWWDAKQKIWAEDAYQDGSATGNVAWAALALLNLYQATQNQAYRGGAARMSEWIRANTLDARVPVGFSGGLDGFDNAQTKLTWKSTEHNIDVYAVATWLDRVDRTSAHANSAATARGFLDGVFVPAEGVFRLGTKPDGTLQPTEHLALDTQLWPVLAVADAPAAWRNAMHAAETQLAVPGGFDFDNDRDGLWVEGTAQAALTLRSLGRGRDAAALLDGLTPQISPSGYLFATREPRITTGLKIGPANGDADFFYYRRPHLGATAWGVLAATGWNPFTGRIVE